MFREMRNKKRQLDSTYIEKILGEGEYGFLATVGENGYPYSVPLSYVYVNNNIYFHSATEGQKLDNIRFNDKVSFCVVGKTKVLPDQFATIYESAIAFGKASFINGEEKKQALINIMKKYSPGFENKGLQYIDRAIDATNIVKIEIEYATAKGRLE
jgi:uncharacterized protein